MQNQAMLAERAEQEIPEARMAWAFCLVAVALILTFDLLTHSVNPSILYLVPLAILGSSPDRKAVFKLLLLAIPATYVGYFFGARDPQFPTLADMLNYRVINRTFVVVAQSGVAGLLYLQGGMSAMILRQRMRDPDDELDQILDAFNLIATISIAGVVVAAVCITDIFSPGNLNLPILFAIPLAFVSRIGSRKVLWSLAFILVVLAAIGFQLGPEPSGTPEIVRSVTTNRELACLGILAVAAALHPWVGYTRRN